METFALLPTISNRNLDASTLLIKFNKQQNDFFKTTIDLIQIDEIITTSTGDFDLMGSYYSTNGTTKDTIQLYHLSSSNEFNLTKQFPSKFDDFIIETALYDPQSNTYYIGGSATNLETRGTVWKNHQDNWIGNISLNENHFEEWVWNRKSLDSINDLDFAGNYIMTVGESWGRTLNDKILQNFRLIKILK